MKKLAAAILAAGESRRMGQPKALVPFAGLTFVEHLLAATRHPRIEIVRVILGSNAESIRAQIPVSADAIVVNENWSQGQLSSIHAAIRSLPPGETAGLLLCPVDHPLITQHLVSQLIAEFDAGQKSIAIPTHHGRRGHPVIFAASLYDELLAASPEVGARQVVWAHPEQVLEIPTDEAGVILNLNDPETMRKALEGAR
ncbi:MAG TPA: nucleotidyltransferase family protein [Candidatus Acidoferrales bacterium]